MFDGVSSSKLLSLAIIMLVVGGVIFLMVVISILRPSGYDSRLKVEGKVTNVSAYSGQAEHRGSSVRSNGYTWYFKIEYDYSVDGIAYSSNRLSNSNKYFQIYQNNPDDNAMPKEIEEYSATYKKGMLVPVYVNRKYPESSYLIYDDSKSGIILSLLISTFFLSIGYIFMRAYLSKG